MSHNLVSDLAEHGGDPLDFTLLINIPSQQKKKKTGSEPGLLGYASWARVLRWLMMQNYWMDSLVR